MNIIFAVTSNRNETYQLLSRSIRGSSIGTIERNSKNVVALISGEYEVFSLNQFLSIITRCRIHIKRNVNNLFRNWSTP